MDDKCLAENQQLFSEHLLYNKFTEHVCTCVIIIGLIHSLPAAPVYIALLVNPLIPL